MTCGATTRADSACPSADVMSCGNLRSALAIVLVLACGATWLAPRASAQTASPAAAASSAAAPAHDMASMKSPPTHDAMRMKSALGPYPMTRDGSGTSWQPEATPMEGLHTVQGDWSVMAHGFVNAIVDRQSGPRG